MTRVHHTSATQTNAPSVRTLRAVWTVAPRVIARRLGTSVPKHAEIVLTIDTDRDTAAAHAVLDGIPIELLARDSAQTMVITSDNAAHLSVKDIIELTALAHNDTYEPVYARAPFLSALNLEPASYDRPRLELS